jgi:hypothetical protein
MLKILLNVRSPYRRQKRDFSIIRSLFRRSLYTGIEISAINIITFLPTTIPYLPTFLRLYRLFLTFLRSHRLFSNFLPFYLLATILTIKQPILTQPIKAALDLPCPGMVNNQLIKNALDFPGPNPQPIRTLEINKERYTSLNISNPTFFIKPTSRILPFLLNLYLEPYLFIKSIPFEYSYHVSTFTT